MTYWFSISEEIVKQSENMGWENFLCSSCRNYKGGCACEKGVFIAFTGANLSTCIYYIQGKKCPHCGRIV